MQYPPGIRIIRTPCTGRLEIDFYMRAFEEGVDGILVAGCEEGSCHFRDGNLVARRRVNYVRDLLTEIGLEADRLRMINVGAADSRRFADNMADMVENVRKLGPIRFKALANKV